jgi:hypothetical protein
MTPYRNATAAHAQGIMANNELLLSTLKRSAKNTRLLHAIRNARNFSVPVQIEHSVALTNSRPVIPPPPSHSQQSPAQLQICVPLRGDHFVFCGLYINPLNAELNPICHLLVLLGDLTFMGPCIVSVFQYISNKM